MAYSAGACPLSQPLMLSDMNECAVIQVYARVPVRLRKTTALLTHRVHEFVHVPVGKLA